VQKRRSRMGREYAIYSFVLEISIRDYLQLYYAVIQFVKIRGNACRPPAALPRSG
jgi:hypothetical protein